jgi:hypothetical protein
LIALILAIGPANATSEDVRQLIASCAKEVPKKQIERCALRKIDEHSIKQLEEKTAGKRYAGSAVTYAKYTCKKEGFTPGVDGFMDCIWANIDKWWHDNEPRLPAMSAPPIIVVQPQQSPEPPFWKPPSRMTCNTLIPGRIDCEQQ